MRKKYPFFNPLLLIIFLLIFLSLTRPDICTKGAVRGILICGNIIIPSLFPFTVCVMFILKSGALYYLKPFSTITNAVFKINAELFSVMLLSLIGGFPVGAKLLNEMVENKKISPENAGIMLNYCINAGPAFIVLAVGNGILGSKKAGYILLFAHLLSSVILALISKKLLSKENLSINENSITKVSESFVQSVSDSASSVIGVCSYVILFSVINSYISFYSINIEFLKIFPFILEVTTALFLSNNILLISFLLGFSGISVWCQVLANARKIKVDYLKFIIFRLLHGIISLIITYFALKLFPLTITTFSNGVSFEFSPYHTNISAGISVVILGIVFIISLYSQKKGGKILEDLV